VTGSSCLKNASSSAVVDENGIKDTWKKDIENLMSEENDWVPGVSWCKRRACRLYCYLRLLLHWKI